jgi:hypothetical protein
MQLAGKGLEGHVQQCGSGASLQKPKGVLCRWRMNTAFCLRQLLNWDWRISCTGRRGAAEGCARRRGGSVLKDMFLAGWLIANPKGLCAGVRERINAQKRWVCLMIGTGNI